MENNHQKNYDELKDNTLDASTEKTVELIEFVKQKTNEASQKVDSSTWQELGIQEMKINTFPKYIKAIELIQKNINEGLKQATTIINTELMPNLEQLRIDSNKYDLLNNEENKEEKQSLQNAIANRKKLIEEITLKINRINIIDVEKELLEKKVKEEINITQMLNNEEIFADVDIDGDATTTTTQSSGNTVPWKTLGENYIVANTKLSAKDYASLVSKNKICETKDIDNYSGKCLSFAYTHAADLYKGYTKDTAKDASGYKYAGEFYDYIDNDKQKTLSKVYEQINQGKPVVMQVNGNKEGTSRHFVTVLGYKSSVTSGATIKEEDLLIMDSYDGNVERMDQKSSRFLITGAACNKKYSGYYLRLLK